MKIPTNSATIISIEISKVIDRFFKTILHCVRMTFSYPYHKLVVPTIICKPLNHTKYVCNQHCDIFCTCIAKNELLT